MPKPTFLIPESRDQHPSSIPIMSRLEGAERTRFYWLWEGYQDVLKREGLSEEDVHTMSRMSVRELFAAITLLRLKQTKAEPTMVEVQQLLAQLDLDDVQWMMQRLAIGDKNGQSNPDGSGGSI